MSQLEETKLVAVLEKMLDTLNEVNKNLKFFGKEVEESETGRRNAELLAGIKQDVEALNGK